MPERHRAELEEFEEQAYAGVAARLVLAVGHPAEVIVDLARENDADMIVVGTRELGFYPAPPWRGRRNASSQMSKWEDA